MARSQSTVADTGSESAAGVNRKGVFGRLFTKVLDNIQARKSIMTLVLGRGGQGRGSSILLLGFALKKTPRLFA